MDEFSHLAETEQAERLRQLALVALEEWGFENADLDLPERSIFLDELRELDGTGETCGPSADEDHIHRDGLGFISRLLFADQLVCWERGLVVTRYERD